nr:DegQ family serine endoprotease [Pseudomarimonas arenosa]
MSRLSKLNVLIVLLVFCSGSAMASLPDFTALVEANSPAVVNISATQTGSARSRQGLPDEEVPEIFRRFFGQPGAPAAPAVPRERVSMGTGFVISADGYVLTNHHVIDGASEIYVRMADRRELKATLVGSDAASDVALLKLEGRNFPAVQIGSSKKLKPGQWVVAIGSPFGFDHSVTAGIVSAVGRASFDRSQQYVPFIQTDVAINRGNSGGPLLDTDGRVVGINSQIFSNTGGFMGVSFAIPIEVAMNATEQLKEKGYVSRGLLGVNIQEVDRDKAKSLGLERTGGALVNGFSDDSAAKKAGIELGDVIVAFNGQELSSAADLPPLVGATKPGSKATVTVVRGGKRQDFQVVITELPRDQLASIGDSAADSGALGLRVEALSDEQREALQLEAGQGVVVAQVTGEQALRAGLRPGDIILMVGRTAVASPRAFEEAVESTESGRPILLLVRRGEQTQFVTISPAADQE